MPLTSDPAVRQCMATFCQQHRVILGVPYMVSFGKDQRIIKEIVSTYGVTKTFSLIYLFFQEIQKDEFLKKTGATVGILKMQIPKLLLKANENKKEEGVGRL